MLGADSENALAASGDGLRPRSVLAEVTKDNIFYGNLNHQKKSFGQDYNEERKSDV